MSTGESCAQKLNYQAQWQNFSYESKMQIAGGSWVLQPVKAFCGMKGLTRNLQECFVNEKPRHRTFRINKNISMTVKITGKGVHRSTDLAKTLKLQTTWL